MSVVEKVLALTEEMITVASKSGKRDEIIERLEQLLDEREKLMSMLQGPYSKEEQALGKKFVLRNQQLMELMNNVKLNIQRDLQQLEWKKKSAQQYANPYEATREVDGAFYDKRL